MSQFALNSEEQATVNRGAGGEVVVTGVARLYKSGGPSWNYTNSWGAATLVADKSTHFIRLVTLHDGQIVFEQELYENFEFAGPTPFFVTFEGNDAVFGLSFADTQDAGAFLQGLSTANVSSGGGASSGGSSDPTLQHTQSLPALPTRPKPGQPPSNTPSRPPLPSTPSTPAMPVSPRGPPPSQPPHGVPSASSPGTPTRPPMHQPPPAAAAASPAPAPSTGGGGSVRGPSPSSGGSSIKKPAKSSGFGGWMKKMTASFTGPDADDVVLSGPTGFRHESHIGWDEHNGFEIRNIPPEWRKLFQAAGVKKSELQDGATAKFIMETVAEAAVGMGPPANAPAPPSGAPAPSAPPPPSFAAAPSAPPPMMGGPAPGAPPPPMPSGGGGASSGGLLAGLQSVQLKTASAHGDGGGLPDLKNMNEEQANNLASTLQKAMAARRPALENDSDEDIHSEDEWSS
eukprot:TRINITY_DN993_c0_g1_i2.p1 TRINITY_DN993_c0_g1~~TRINITY_DN993_c0_g1_i2.p1  ORF type:complete len:457 (-),score=103.84 TRINITY_DN993_c0_g1_i2:114-1484(-)